MSAAPDARNDGKSQADIHHHPAFDPEPARVLPADETRTPMWVPLLGLVLFVSAATGALLFGDDSKTEKNAAPEQKTAITKTAPELPVQPIAPPPQMRIPTPGSTSSAPSVQRLSPDQAKALQERLEQMRNRGVAPKPAPNPPGGP